MHVIILKRGTGTSALSELIYMLYIVFLFILYLFICITFIMCLCLSYYGLSNNRVLAFSCIVSLCCCIIMAFFISFGLLYFFTVRYFLVPFHVCDVQLSVYFSMLYIHHCIYLVFVVLISFIILAIFYPPLK